MIHLKNVDTNYRPTSSLKIDYASNKLVAYFHFRCNWMKPQKPGELK